MARSSARSGDGGGYSCEIFFGDRIAFVFYSFGPFLFAEKRFFSGVGQRIACILPAPGEILLLCVEDI